MQLLNTDRLGWAWRTHHTQHEQPCHGSLQSERRDLACFSSRFAALSSSRICATLLELGKAKNCKIKPMRVRMNPIVTNAGLSTLTTAAGLACSHSGHVLDPRLKAPPGCDVSKARLFTHRADLPSLVVMSLKFEDVA